MKMDDFEFTGPRYQPDGTTMLEKMQKHGKPKPKCLVPDRIKADKEKEDLFISFVDKFSREGRSLFLRGMYRTLTRKLKNEINEQLTTKNK